MNNEKLLSLKDAIERLRKERDKSKVLYEKHLEDLQKDHECAGIKDAEKKIREIRKEKNSLETEFTKALKEWEEQWQEQI